MIRNGLALWAVRFRYLNWQTDPDSPGRTQVDDLRHALDLANEVHNGLPVVLVGHSMGARVALRSSDRESVAGVIGLAPWWPDDESAELVRGKRLAAAFNPKDLDVQRPEIERFADRARAVGAHVELQSVGGSGPGGVLAHAMVWNPGTLHGFIHAQCDKMLTPNR